MTVRSYYVDKDFLYVFIVTLETWPSFKVMTQWHPYFMGKHYTFIREDFIFV